MFIGCWLRASSDPSEVIKYHQVLLKVFDCGVSCAMNSGPAKAGKHQIRGWKVSADHLFFVLKADLSPKAISQCLRSDIWPAVRII